MQKYLTIEKSNYLKSIILRAGYDIGIMAGKMGMSRSTLSSRINGKSDFSRSEMERFAKIVGDKPEKIFY